MRALSWLSLVFVFAFAAPTLGQGGAVKDKSQATPQEKAQAKKHYQQAELHFRLGEFALAVEEYKEAFRYYPDPAFLFNIAQNYRLMEDYEQALFFFRNYLDVSPTAPNRAEVEKLILEAKEKIAAKPKEVLPEVVPESAPVVKEPTSGALLVSNGAEKEEVAKTPKRRWWIFAAVGVAAAAGVGVFVASSGKPIPPTTLGDVPLF